VEEEVAAGESAKASEVAAARCLDEHGGVEATLEIGDLYVPDLEKREATKGACL
jgi:hypothetical protein